MRATAQMVAEPPSLAERTPFARVRHAITGYLRDPLAVRGGRFRTDAASPAAGNRICVVLKAGSP
ncbi:MAG: hypothetical protein IRZ07_10390 [Microbispora sp.]|nr:hypothetical protein [Microbispora sp.]